MKFIWNYRGHNSGFYQRGPNWVQFTFPPSRKSRRCAFIFGYESYGRRVREAWQVLTGKASLHRSWQAGYDQHIRDESARRAQIKSWPTKDQMMATHDRTMQMLRDA